MDGLTRYLKSTIDQRAAICEYSPAVTWHDVQVTEGQAGTIGSRTDATARAVIECAADAIVAFSTDRTVMLWNPAAERMFGWAAAEVLGLEPPIIPEELQAEHNAVLERVRGGGQISFATRRIRKDGDAARPADRHQRADRTAAGEVTGWVNVCHQTGGGRRGPALHGRAGPGGAPARRRRRRHERPARPGGGARPHRGQPARADQRRRGRVRAHRGRPAAPGQHGRAAGPAARPHRRPAHQPGRRADAVRARRS